MCILPFMDSKSQTRDGRREWLTLLLKDDHIKYYWLHSAGEKFSSVRCRLCVDHEIRGYHTRASCCPSISIVGRPQIISGSSGDHCGYGAFFCHIPALLIRSYLPNASCIRHPASEEVALATAMLYRLNQSSSRLTQRVIQSSRPQSVNTCLLRHISCHDQHFSTDQSHPERSTGQEFQESLSNQQLPSFFLGGPSRAWTCDLAIMSRLL